MNRLFSWALLVAVFSLLVILDACVDHDFGSPFVVDCEGLSEISYTGEVKPIISSNCAISGCHNGDSQDIPNWHLIENLQDRRSEIQRRITLPLTDPAHMPAEGSITDEERQTIYCWIAQGALDN